MSGHHLHTGDHATEVRKWAQRVEAIADRLNPQKPVDSPSMPS